MRFTSLLFIAACLVVAGCPSSSTTDAGPDARLGFDANVPDAPSVDAPTRDTGLLRDAVAIDAPMQDSALADSAIDAMCLPSGSDCSITSGNPCCAPDRCVATGGDGTYRCVDTTGCIGPDTPCGPTDRCCPGTVCVAGSCVGVP